MRLFDVLHNQFKLNPLDDAFAQKVNGEWRKFSTEESIRITNQLSQGLLEIGVQPGDKIAIVSEGRAEWCFIDMAVQQVGGVLVPLYPTLSAKDYNIILDEAEVKVLFAFNSEIIKKLSGVIKRHQLEHVFSLRRVKGFDAWVDLLAKGKGKNKEELRDRISNVKDTDLTTIIYTSGTSGRPKGVMLTHRNIMSNLMENMKASTLVPGDRALSFLPMNHIFEKAGVFFFMNCGAAVYFAESIETIGDNLREVQPHTFNTVPRLLEKVFDRIMKTGSELSGLKKGIFNWAIDLGLNYEIGGKGAFYNRQLNLANKLVFSKWREALGGNIKQIQSGASALQPRLSRIFWAAGIKVLEGYGLTETSPVVTASRVDATKFGCVGQVYDNLDVKLSEDGEIMLKGPSVTSGYFKQPEVTKEAFTSDGWFLTGDIGEFDADGYLKITDRKKEMFKTSGGLYIAPQQIENKLRESVFIDQAMVIGENKKFPAVLISPNMEELLEELHSDFDERSIGELIKSPQAQQIFQSELDRVNDSLGQWEQLKKFAVVESEWSPESGELTPTQKLKRRVIKETCKKYITEMYSDDFSVQLDDLEQLKTEDINIDELEELSA